MAMSLSYGYVHIPRFKPQNTQLLSLSIIADTTFKAGRLRQL